jgi:hypothetical protein
MSDTADRQTLSIPRPDYTRLLEVDGAMQGLAAWSGLSWPPKVPAPWRLKPGGDANPAATGFAAGNPATPFHVSPEFLSLPKCWRLEFLLRNPAALALLCYMGQVQEVAGRLKQTVGAAYPPGDDSRTLLRGQVKPQSPEVVPLWQIVHRCGWRLAALLEEHFGICFSGPGLGDGRLGPPSCFCGIKRGLEPEEWADLWLDAYWAHSDDRARRRAVLDAWEMFVTTTLGGWDDPRVAQLRDWGALTRRQRSAFTKLLEKIRRDCKLPQFRQQQDDYFSRLLAVWDAREGWTGECYDPAQAVTLREAMQQAGEKRPDTYYRAFHLVSGVPYSDVAWDIFFGSSWREALDPETYRRLRAMPMRRRAGRRKGSSAAVSDQETEAEINKLVAMLKQGIEVREAVAKVNLPDDLKRILTDPENAPDVQRWAEDKRRR